MSEVAVMNKNPILPKNPEYIDSGCESATHSCGRCGRSHNLEALAASLSPCCSVVCYPLSGGQIFALGGQPNEGGKETINSYLSRGTPPGGQEMKELGH
jgi:hypothetical protein